MEGENEDLDEFMDEVSSKYASHFWQMDQIIDAQSDVRVYGFSDYLHIKALVRASAMTSFIIITVAVIVHWLSYSVNELAGPVSSFEVLLFTGSLFLNIGVYAVSIAERMNLLIMKVQLKHSLRKTKTD